MEISKHGYSISITWNINNRRWDIYVYKNILPTGHYFVHREWTNKRLHSVSDGFLIGYLRGLLKELDKLWQQ